MSRGKHLSLEEARKKGLLDGFASEYPNEADTELFDRLLKARPRERSQKKREHQMTALAKIEAKLELAEIFRQALLGTQACVPLTRA